MYSEFTITEELRGILKPIQNTQREGIEGNSEKMNKCDVCFSFMKYAKTMK